MSRTAGEVFAAATVIDADGIETRRALPRTDRDHVDPFVLLEEIGPVAFQPADVRTAGVHPVYGVEELTWMLEGTLRTQWPDVVSVVGPGAALWTCAARGLVRSEEFEAGQVHAIRVALRLPPSERSRPFETRHIGAGDVGTDMTARNVRADVIAGPMLGARPPVLSRSRALIARLRLPPNVTFVHPVGYEEPDVAPPTVLVYTIAGTGFAGADGAERRLVKGDVARLMPLPAAPRPNADQIRLRTEAGAALDVLVLAALPVSDTILRRGALVVRTEEEHLQGIRDFRAGRLGSLP
jgi:quercetin 2,3-dioxygenase